MLEAVFPVFLVEMNDGFGVAVSAVGVSTRDQRFAQRLVVVDFAIEDDPERAVLVAHGLVAGGEIHDAEPAHADADAILRIYPLVVRPAMGHHVTHLAQDRWISLRVFLKLEESGYSTHSGLSISSWLTAQDQGARTWFRGLARVRCCRRRMFSAYLAHTSIRIFPPVASETRPRCHAIGLRCPQPV